MRAAVSHLELLRRRVGDEVAWVWLYTQEAHAEDTLDSASRDGNDGMMSGSILQQLAGNAPASWVRRLSQLVRGGEDEEEDSQQQQEHQHQHQAHQQQQPPPSSGVDFTHLGPWGLPSGAFGRTISQRARLRHACEFYARKQLGGSILLDGVARANDGSVVASELWDGADHDDVQGWRAWDEKVQELLPTCNRLLQGDSGRVVVFDTSGRVSYASRR